MKTTTLHQNDLPTAPLRPGKGESNESHRRYRQQALEFYALALKAGMKPHAAAAYVGASLRTLRIWQQRRRHQGERGLLPRSRRPKTKRKSVINDPKLRDIAATLRNKYRCGPVPLASYLREHGYHLSVPTVKRLLASLREEGRVARITLGKQRKPARGNYKRPKPAPNMGAEPYQRADAQALLPGERVQMDTVFARYSGGHLAIINAVDVSTRLATQHIVVDLTSRAAGEALRATNAYFQSVLGTGIGTVQVDGGGEFLGDFVRVCEELGIKRMVNPPYNPKCNAHIESFNGGFRRECLNGLPRASTGETIRAAVASYTRFYNAKRCHSALGGESPIMALKRLPPQSRQKCNMW